MLKPGGIFISLSFSQPNWRTYHYTRPHLKLGPLKTIAFHAPGKKSPAPNHAFIGCKEDGADEQAELNWEATLE